MARPGRKPTAIVEKEMLGNPGHRPTTPVIPDPPDGDMTMPPRVARNPYAAWYWNHYLSTSRHLKPVDIPALQTLCLIHALIDKTLDEMGDATILVRSPDKGTPMQNPWLPTLNRQRDLARKYAADLILLPSERNRIDPHGDSIAVDPTEQYFDA